MGDAEQSLILDAFASNWIAPLGPHVDAFEQEFAQLVGVRHALALSSGTAALHLALLLAGVERGDDVFVSTLTFSASVNPIVYLGGTPVLIDSERESWNIDPELVAEELHSRVRAGKRPRAIVIVHLYGQSANLDPLLAAAATYEVPVIEDAAEALGSTYHGRTPGAFGKAGIYSFNGNKIITTSGGGMLVSDDEAFVAHARKLSTQAREDAPHYEHREIGYNYRLSNLLAAVGRGQLQVLEQRVASRRSNFDFYVNTIGHLPGVEFMPEASWGRHSRWLTTLTIDPEAFGADREEIRLALQAENIEARPVWKPMHLQPVFADAPVVGGRVAADLFERGLCLPSGSNLTKSDLERVATVILDVASRPQQREIPAAKMR